MQPIKKLALAVLTASLLACGGGGGGGGSSSSSSSSEPEVTVSGNKVNDQEASRFMAQASFGATQTGINEIVATNVETWIERQFNKPQSLHLSYVDTIAANLGTGQSLSENHFQESFWGKAIRADDQLRQRVSFALSEIFVVSFNGVLGGNVRTVASYYDMLGRNAFGNYRTLLEDVSLHPAMGQYLSHLRNQKENLSSGRMPDENYAREVMQLFTIGLYELNSDGSLKQSGGKPIETYTNDDVTGLAKVFTGWSWSGPDKSNTRFFGGNADANRDVTPMQSYPNYHSTSAKNFLGVTIAAQTTANPEASLKVALDTLFNHPNVGPFIGQQLIQRLVTSNPSPAYVGRVAAAFNNNGKGVRGDMKAVIRAILLDSEARSAVTAQANSYGKLREPVVRLANWARAFDAVTTSGRYAIGNTDSNTSALAQSAMRSPSVFNFFRPGYVAPGSVSGSNNLMAPELQITDETSVAGYLNYMQNVIKSGPSSSTGQSADRVVASYANWVSLADTPTALVDKVNLILCANSLSSATRTLIVNAVTGIAISTTNSSSAATARLNRVYLTVMLAMASPEYLVQK